MKYKLIYLKEPTLTFGYNQKAVDPRDGLTLFGPFTREKIHYTSIGVIGTNDGRERFIRWLKKIQKPVFSIDNDVARPYFPGIEAAFNISINFDAIKQINIEQQSIEHYLRYSDSYQRVHNLVNLYVDKLIKHEKEEEQPVLVWFVMIPDVIRTYCRPKSSIPSSPDNITLGIKGRYSRTAPLLFSESAELQEAYRYEINFHNQLKAKLLEHGIVTQIVRESTIAYKDFITKDKLIKTLEKFESAIAWNISNALYYKSGGLPWILGDIREGVCYVGLVYKKVETDEDEGNACCAAQMFLDSGDGFVFRGNVGPWYNPNSSEYHLSEDSAYELLDKALQTYIEKNNTYPKEIFIHAKTYFNDEEWSGFEKAAKGKSRVIGVRIRNDNTFKLYREYTYPVPRGMALIIDTRKAFLWSKGFVPRLQTVIGLETPNPLSVEITKGEADIKTVCKDVLALTKLNYNSCIYGDGIPVTLRFADSIGEILTAGPTKDIGVLPFKHYI